MRSSPTSNNNTLLRIQQEINEVAARENELRNTYQYQNQGNGITNGSNNGSANSNRSMSPISPTLSPTPPPFQNSHPNNIARQPSTTSVNNGATPNPIVNQVPVVRRFIPNPNLSTKGVMQKFFKSRGKISTVTALTSNNNNNNNNNNVSNGVHSKQNSINWNNSEVLEKPAKALIPEDKPLRKGYVPVGERIQKELREMKSREEELRFHRRQSQPDLMAALEAERDQASLSSDSRSSSPIPFPGKLRNSRSFSQLLDEDLDDIVNGSGQSSLRPARSLAELCDAPDEEIESPRNLIQQWESRIRQSQDSQ